MKARPYGWIAELISEYIIIKKMTDEREPRKMVVQHAPCKLQYSY
jgi:hypothetical protein